MRNNYDKMIQDAGWFPGTTKQWDDLPRERQKDLAFAATGCEVAYATWTPPVDCVHTCCRLRRGEIQPIVVTNQILKSEISSGWLRFSKETPEGRRQLAYAIRAIRREAIKTGIYNPWELSGGWQLIVGIAISA